MRRENMGTLCVPIKTFYLLLKGCKWGFPLKDAGAKSVAIDNRVSVILFLL